MIIILHVTVHMYQYVLLFRCTTLEGAFLNWRRLGDGMDYACPIKYNAEYRQVETQGKAEGTAGSDTEDSAGILYWMNDWGSIPGRSVVYFCIRRHIPHDCAHSNQLCLSLMSDHV